MEGKVKGAIFGTIFATVILVIIVVMIIVQKFAPSKERIDINEFYKVATEEALIIFQNGIYEERALIENDIAYLDYDTVVEFMNKRFYWDNNENLLIYTTPTELIRTEIGSKRYTINKNVNELNYPITKKKGDTLYIALDFVDMYSNIEYQTYESPNRIVIQNEWGEFLYTKTEKNTQLRVKDSIKSEILLDLEKDVELTYVETDIIHGNNFSKVMTKDGIIGYVKDKHTAKSYYKTLTSNFKEPEYIHTKKETPINLVWHQVTSQAANNNLLEVIEGTKGVTTISPTWYSIDSNDGTISSLADETYVERAHSLGIEVWGLVDDFNPDINIVDILSHTSKREKLINELISSAIKYNLDGINIDFEKIPLEGGIHFIQFIRELSIKCRSNEIVLSIDNYTPAEYSSYYNLTEQGIVSDYVIIMAYDEHYPGMGKSGSVASIGFVESAIEKTLAMVDKEKIIIGIPFYTRLWKENSTTNDIESEALAMSVAEDTVKANEVEPIWDEETGQHYVEYEKDNITFKMWLEDEASIEMKMKAIQKGEVAGVASWKLGLEKNEIWNVINKYLQ